MEFKLKHLEIEPTIIPEEGEGEIWKVCEDFPRYEISSFGRVRRVKDGYILSQRTNAGGYKELCLTIETGKTKFVRVHTLVAKAFCEGYDEEEGKILIDHIDTCRYNNYYKNLRYVTKSENFYNTKNSRKGISRTKVPITLIDKETNQPIEFFASIREASEKLHLNEDNIAYNIHRSRKPFKIGYFVLTENLTK